MREAASNPQLMEITGENCQLWIQVSLKEKCTFLFRKNKHFTFKILEKAQSKKKVFFIVLNSQEH
jgi:hypothetical protein